MEAKDTHISMYLSAVGGESCVRYSLRVRNQEDPSEHVSSDPINHAFPPGESCGEREMMLLESLTQPGFVVDDCLEVSVEGTVCSSAPETQAKALALIAKMDGGVLLLAKYTKTITRLLENATDTEVEVGALLALLDKLELNSTASIEGTAGLSRALVKVLVRSEQPEEQKMKVLQLLGELPDALDEVEEAVATVFDWLRTLTEIETGRCVVGLLGKIASKDLRMHSATVVDMWKQHPVPELREEVRRVLVPKVNTVVSGEMTQHQQILSLAACLDEDDEDDEDDE